MVKEEVRGFGTGKGVGINFPYRCSLLIGNDLSPGVCYNGDGIFKKTMDYIKLVFLLGITGFSGC